MVRGIGVRDASHSVLARRRAIGESYPKQAIPSAGRSNYSAESAPREARLEADVVLISNRETENRTASMSRRTRGEWFSAVSLLGRGNAKRSRATRPEARSLRLESLEERRMLATY